MNAWGQIKDFPEYQVSLNGEVISNKNGNVITLKASMNSNGYYTVTLCNNGKGTKKYIHRLVAETFIANPQCKKQVNHIDEDKTNNRIENLEWTTPKENTNHGTGIERSTMKRGKPIISTNITTGESKTFNSISEAARVLSLDHGSIAKNIKGIRHRVSNYTFKLKEVDLYGVHALH